MFVGMLYLSNFADELFFDPTKFDWNEYVGAIAACLISYLEYKGVDIMIKNSIRSWVKRITFDRNI